MSQSSQTPVYSPLTKAVSITALQKLKANHEKFTVIALYDAANAKIAHEAGVDVVLIGDSLGMTVMGHNSTLPVTVDNVVYHVEAVARGNKLSLIMSDLPFMSYSTLPDALHNCARVMRAGAHIVKLEGGTWLCDTVRALVQSGIPVCGHLGLTPQSVNVFGGYRIQGRDETAAEQIVNDAKALEAAGASIVLLECVPSALAARVTTELTIPVIGIGAGVHTDAQVLVINDMIGLTEQPPKFSKNFLTEAGSIKGAMQAYVRDVKENRFPADENTFF